MKQAYALDVSRVVLGAPCSGCGENIAPDALGMVSRDACDFYCFACVTMAYEAMKAAQ